MRTFVRVVLPILCLGWVGSVYAQETLSSVQRELDRVEREIEREKELHKQEIKRASEFSTQKAQRLQALVDQTKLTQARIDSLKKEVEKARRKKTAEKAQAQFYSSKEKEFRQSMAASLLSLANDMRSDFPYSREKRIADLEELAKSVAEGVIPTEEALNRMTGLLSASLDFAANIEVYAGVYTAKTGGSSEGTYLRLGAAFLAFISQDARVGALIVRNEGKYDSLDSELTPKVLDALSAAVRVAQGKESPRLVGLPLVLNPKRDTTVSEGAHP